MIATYILYSLGGLIILFSLIPLVRNDYWVFRVFEYPRLQKFIISFGLLITSAVFLDLHVNFNLYFGLLLLGNTIYLGNQIYPFTPLAKRQLHSFKGTDYDPSSIVKLMVANVYQYNRKSIKLIEIIDRCDPDILLMVETDQWWSDQVKEVCSRYPHQKLVPLDNTYGLLFFTRCEVEKATVNYLVEDDKPSIDTTLILGNGKKIRFFGIHPAPPAPMHNTHTTERDKELLIVGKMAQEEQLPVIVTGDLNDVAWSYSTELFNNYSELLDPRIGRGLYNTFHAKYPLFRWPLDHIFCCSKFELIRLQRLPAFGSDHFPLFIELKLTENEDVNDIPQASEEDQELAKEKLRAEI